jgi:integrase
MTWPEWALLSQLAIATGLRSNKLRSLARGSVALDAARRFVRVKADATKNGKTCQQFIDRELAALLKEHSAQKTPAARLFTLPNRTKLAKMIRAD